MGHVAFIFYHDKYKKNNIMRVVFNQMVEQDDGNDQQGEFESKRMTWGKNPTK